MTIQSLSGLAPTPSSYTSAVNAAPTRPVTFPAAYARYLRLRADTFDADLSTSDTALEALIAAETQALLDAAAAPARGVEEFALKLQLLQGDLEAHNGGSTASMLATCLSADLRHL
jgi:hypothetical protein